MFPPRTEILENQGEEDKMPEWTDSERANLNMGRGVNVVRRSAAEKFHGRLDYNLWPQFAVGSGLIFLLSRGRWF